MRCETHCPPEAGSALAAPLLALGSFLVVGAAVWVVSQLAPLLVALGVVEAVAIAAGLFGVVRLVRYGSLRKPKVAKPLRALRAPVGNQLATPARRALPAPVKGMPVFVVTPGMVLRVDGSERMKA